MKGPLAMRRVALMFGALCAILAIWFLALRPAVLTIAVGPSNSTQAAVVATVAKLLRETRQPFRFKILTAEGTEDSSKLLDARRVDLALLRAAVGGAAQTKEPWLRLGMAQVGAIECACVEEHRHGVVERHAVLVRVGRRLARSHSNTHSVCTECGMLPRDGLDVRAVIAVVPGAKDRL